MTEKVNGQIVDLPSQVERRACPRYRPSSVAYVNVGAENGGIVLNISESGIELSAGETLAWDDSVRLSLQLSYRADPIEAMGQVIWLSESKRTAGFQFVSLTEQVRNQIRGWIENEEGVAVDRSHQPNAGDAIAEQRAPTEIMQLPIDARSEELPFEVDTLKVPVGPSEELAETSEWTGPTGEAPRNEPPVAEPANWIPIAIVSGLMLLCFAVGVMVGVIWSRNEFRNRNRTASMATTVSESAAPNDSPSAEPIPQAHAAQPTENVGPTEIPEASIEVVAPDENAQPELVTLPELAVSTSDSVAITVRQLVLVPAAPGPASAHHPQRLVGGKIAGPPAGPLPSGLVIEAAGDVVRLRLSIDEQGELNDLIPVEGRSDLVSIAKDIVRRWIQTPSTLSGEPIASIEDVTVTFRRKP
jgi:PilZ domain